MIHRSKFLPHISVSDYSATSRRPSAIEDNPENDQINSTMMLNSSSQFNSNNLFSSDASNTSNTSTSRTSLHDQLSSSNSSSIGTTPNLLLSNSSTFDDCQYNSVGQQSRQILSMHHLQATNKEIARRNSSENDCNNKLNPNTLIYRQSRSLSNSAHSQEIEDQLLEKSFYSSPTLTKNVSINY